ncbi:cadmium transporter [Rhodococcus sp. D2-41]|uniref:Cadmium resistance transporter n=1 Tax=Speluncibacter jeojiensis TaxID=2710754 RepID=A0A9X4REY0_9ACTN|nr:cadmium resistance transporter [Rhodococcus sp. D2-41]MDG3009989.1 cadmium transporter [Rhodococcus sp. D2-41]MDG3016309.1 cadmium resistance transporter [Corynebacteriales bacterium D3-21]
MHLALIGRAFGMFVVTNIDDLVVLALFFGRAVGQPPAQLRIVVGQYLGFLGILVVAAVGGLGIGMLPGGAVRFAGLLPLVLGLRLVWREWRTAGAVLDGGGLVRSRPGVWTVAAVTLANGGDNLSVYIPVFGSGPALDIAGYAAVFLVLVGVWCGLGILVAGRAPVARALARWDRVLLPVVLIGIGVSVLVLG